MENLEPQPQLKKQLWATEIKAIDPVDGEMKTWVGPHVEGTTTEEAKQYCQDNGLGYCDVVGQVG